MRHHNSAQVAHFIADRAVPVTVAVPVYNGGKYLHDCLESIANQSFENFVVIVVDNASNDDTASICEGFSDDRFFYSRNPANVGSIGNHNICLEKSQTPFVKMFSADDVLFRETLGDQYLICERYPNVGLVTSNLIETDSTLKAIREITYLQGQLRGANAVDACVRKVQNLIGGPSNILLRMSAVGNLRFDNNLHWLADLAFHCKVLDSSDYCNIDKVGFYYRRHNASDSVVGCLPEVRLKDEKAFLSAFGGGFQSYARIFARQMRQSLSAKFSRE